MTIQTDVLDPALRKIGVTSPSTTDRTNALEAYNNMVSSLSNDDAILPFYTRESFSLTVGKGSYTIGAGGDFDTIRPVEVVSAYIRDSSGNDHEVNVKMSLKEYNLINDKDREGRPDRLCYLREYTVGKILFNKEPDTVETLYLDSLKQISELATVLTTLTIPPEYKEFLIYSLVIRIAPEHNYAVEPEIVAIAKNSYKRIINQNIKSLFSKVKMDNALLINVASSDIKSG